MTQMTMLVPGGYVRPGGFWRLGPKLVERVLVVYDTYVGVVAIVVVATLLCMIRVDLTTSAEAQHTSMFVPLFSPNVPCCCL